MLRQTHLTARDHLFIAYSSPPVGLCIYVKLFITVMLYFLYANVYPQVFINRQKASSKAK